MLTIEFYRLITTGFKNKVSKGFLIFSCINSIPYSAFNELVKWIGLIINSFLIKYYYISYGPVIYSTGFNETFTLRSGYSFLIKLHTCQDYKFTTLDFLIISSIWKLSYFSKLIW